MKIIHRFRMWKFNLSAKWLLSRARRAHANRPHVQSEFMIGRTTPKKPTDFEMTARYVLLLFVVVFIVGCINAAVVDDRGHTCTKSKAILSKMV